MLKIFAHRRFLAIYSGVLTLLLLVGVLCGFALVRERQTSDVLTVRRINIVEPDGTIRMVLSNEHDAPGAYIRNKELPHTSRQAAGLLFFDNEGTEDGGLIYGLDRDSSGRVTGNNVHLSFDQYMQDQIFAVDAGRNERGKYSSLAIDDVGDYPITESLDASNRIHALPEKDQAAAWDRFRETHPGDHRRVVLGRSPDGSSVLRLKDPAGRDRIVLKVGPDGNPEIETLDAAGKIVDSLPRPK